MRKVLLVIGCILGCEAVGLLATPFTISAIPTWYATLHKPFFSPPNWLFGPVWTLLYALMGISLYLVVQKGWKKKVKIAVAYFAIQLLLNFLWSVVFFGLHSPLAGLVDILLLEISIILTIRIFASVSRPASLLLLPYFLWVSFAMILNIAIVLLN